MARIKKICALLKQLGYEVIEQNCDPLLYEHLRKDHPEVVFNLSSIYGWEKANLVPAVLEVAKVHYTGSGMLGLSLARNYTKLFPLLYNSGIRVPPFHIIAAESSVPLQELHYPLRLYRDGEKRVLLLRNGDELLRVLNKLPAHKKVLLLEPALGKRVSLYLLDNLPILGTPGNACLATAQKVYRIMEARGLVHFDFIQNDPPVLVNVEIAPDPLDEELLHEAQQAGWDAPHLLQLLVEHAGSDL
jgi:D-alanine-D-alanine ligase-like ATP-grasp enzyme